MKKIIAEKQTEYGLIQVEDRDDYRYLLVNHEMESCITLKERKEILFPYMKQFSYAFSASPDIHSCLLIGGGACAYPAFYLRHYPDKIIDVVEISPDILQIAREYFYLSELEENERFHIYNMDAALFLSTRSEKYDLIINDAFIGREESLRKPDAVKMIYDHLHHNGIYMLNLVSAINGPFARNLKMTQKALKTCFNDVLFIPCSEQYTSFEKQNLLMAASDRPLP